MNLPARVTPGVPARWSYTVSVRRMKATVWKWKRITVSMAHELWVAHQALTRPGARSDRVANATRSWAGYLEDIGLDRVTAWRWLKQYDPQQRKLIEVQPKPRIEAQPAPVEQTPSPPVEAEAPRQVDLEQQTLRDLRPVIAHMSFAHRLRLAAEILIGR